MDNQYLLNKNKTIVLELNYRCNLQCIHCYVPDEEKTASRFMTFDDARKILGQLLENGLHRILLTGGEPLLNPDFNRIYEYAWDKGFLISVFTNATRLTTRTQDLLIAKKPEFVRVSLFGGDSGSYELITGHDQFSLVCDKIFFLKLNGVKTTVKTPLLRQNQAHALKEIQREFSKAGIPVKIETRVLPRFNGDNMALHYRYSPREIIDLEIDNVKRGLEMFGQLDRQKKVKNLNDCIHVCQPFVIDPESNLQLCFFIREWKISLKSTPFTEAVALLTEKITGGQDILQESECHDCENQFMCPYCPGWAKTEVGVLNKKIPFLCQLTDGYRHKYEDLSGKEVKDAESEESSCL